MPIILQMRALKHATFMIMPKIVLQCACVPITNHISGKVADDVLRLQQVKGPQTGGGRVRRLSLKCLAVTQDRKPYGT